MMTGLVFLLGITAAIIGVGRVQSLFNAASPDPAVYDLSGNPAADDLSGNPAADDLSGNPAADDLSGNPVQSKSADDQPVLEPEQNDIADVNDSVVSVPTPPDALDVSIQSMWAPLF